MSRTHKSLSLVAVITALISLSAVQAQRPPSGFTWTDPRNGAVYTLPQELASVWPQLPDSIKRSVLEFDEGARARLAADLRTAQDARDAALRTKLAALGREATALERAAIEADAAAAAHTAILALPPTANRGRLVKALELEAAARVADARRTEVSNATGRVPRIQIFGQQKGTTTTLERLMADTLAEGDKLRELNRTQNLSIPIESSFLMVMDPETGNTAFFPERSTAISVGEAIAAIRSAQGKAIVGRVSFLERAGTSVEWTIDLATLPSGFDATDRVAVTRMLAVLANDDAGDALKGAVVKVKGNHAFVGGDTRWWTFSADSEILTPRNPPPLAEGAIDPAPFFPRAESPPVAPPATTAAAEIPAMDAELPPPNAVDPAPPVVKPGPTDPALEAQIEQFLRDNAAEKLEAPLRQGNFGVFQHPLFKSSDDPEARARVARTWKKVCSKPEFAAQSEVLAKYRWELLANAWGSVAARYGVQIELINSGKRNAYRSDLDVTVYAPIEQRRGIPMSELIKDFEAIFESSTRGTNAAAFDITVHDGDIFMPDSRNHGQQYMEYQPALRETVRKLQLKVQSGGDAYVSPGGNLYEVQRRGLQGQVVILSPEFVVTKFVEVEEVLPGGDKIKRKVPTETRYITRRSPPLPVSWLDPDSGAWRTNSSRFRGIEPVYDRRAAFGEISNSLDNLVEHMDDPALVAKYANRAINSGLGSREVNSYWNIHVSNPEIPPYKEFVQFLNEAWPAWEEARAHAGNDPYLQQEFQWDAQFQFERYEAARQLYEQQQRNPIKQAAKDRWIRRTFGVVGDGDVKRIRQILDANANIELAKIRGDFDWNAQASDYLFDTPYHAAARGAVRTPHQDELDRMIEQQPELLRRNVDFLEMLDALAVTAAKAARPELAGKPDAEVLAVLFAEEAIKYHAAATRDLIARAVVIEAVAAMKDMTPRRMVYNSFRFVKDPKTGRPIALSDSEAGLKLAEQRKVELVLTFDVLNRLEDRALATALRQQVLDAAPSEIRVEVERLARVAETRLDYFMRVFEAAPIPGETPIDKKRRLLERAVEGLNVPEPPAGPPDASLVKAMQRRLIEKFGAPTAKFFRDFGPEFARTTPGARPARPGENAGFGAWGEAVVGNLNLLMLSNTAINLGFAYASGDRVRFHEAVINELGMWMPPQYGLVVSLLKDFATIRDLRTGQTDYLKPVKSIGFIVAVHAVPVLGEILLAGNAVGGLVFGSYVFAVTRMNNDLVEQAFKSRPVRNLEHATPVRQRDSTYIFAQDTPRYPLLFEYDKCADPAISMKTEFDWTTPTAADGVRFFGPTIRRILLTTKKEDGVTPRYKEGTPEWRAEESRLIEKFAFELPYYLRMSKIYRCFRGAFTTNYYDTREAVFTKVVDDWLSAQPQDYQKQFDSFWDIGPWAGDTRRRMSRMFVNQLIDEYDKYMIVESQAESSESEIRIAISMADALWGKLEKRADLAIEKLGAMIEQREKTRAAALIQQSQQQPKARVRVVAPTWYVRLAHSGISNTALTGSRPSSVRPTDQRAGETFGVATVDLDDDLPITVVVSASRDKYAGEWEARLSANVGTIVREKPQGLMATPEEQQLLDRKRPDGTPMYTMLTVPLTVTATVVDARQQLIARSEPVPVIGYLIAPIPRHTADVVVAVKGAPGGTQTAAAIQAQVQLGDGTVTTSPTSDGRQTALFRGMPAGRHTIRAQSIDPRFGTGTATVDIADPYTADAYRSNAEPKRDYLVEVTLPFVGTAETPTPPTKNTEEKSPGPGGSGSDGTTKPPRTPEGNKEDTAQGSSGKTGNTGQAGQGSTGQTGQGNTGQAGQGNTGRTGPGNTGQTGQGNSGDSSGRNPGGQAQRGPDPSLVNECATYLQRAREALADGDAGGAANWLGIAQEKCGAAGPAIGGAIDQSVAGVGGAIQGAIDNCNPEEAYHIAQQSRRAFSRNPQLTAWLDANFEKLSRQANAARTAREFRTQAEEALRRRDLNAAIAALQRIVELRDLPNCMGDNVKGVLGDLIRRRNFGELVNDLVTASENCEYDAALRIMGQIEAIQPRDETMNAWFALNKRADLAEAKRRLDRAAEIKADALTVWQSATTQTDFDQVVTLLEQARAMAPDCATKLDLDRLLREARAKKPTTPPVRNPPPPPEPPEPPAPPRPPAPPTPGPAAAFACTINVTPAAAYHGDPVAVTIEIDPRAIGQVTRVRTSNAACPDCTAGRGVGNRYTQQLFMTGKPSIGLVASAPGPMGPNDGASSTGTLPGFAQTVPIDFTATSGDNRSICTGSTEVKFSGVKPPTAGPGPTNASIPEMLLIEGGRIDQKEIMGTLSLRPIDATEGRNLAQTKYGRNTLIARATCDQPGVTFYTGEIDWQGNYIKTRATRYGGALERARVIACIQPGRPDRNSTTLYAKFDGSEEQGLGGWIELTVREGATQFQGRLDFDRGDSMFQGPVVFKP